MGVGSSGNGGLPGGAQQQNGRVSRIIKAVKSQARRQWARRRNSESAADITNEVNEMACARSRGVRKEKLRAQGADATWGEIGASRRGEVTNTRPNRHRDRPENPIAAASRREKPKRSYVRLIAAALREI